LETFHTADGHKPYCRPEETVTTRRDGLITVDRYIFGDGVLHERFFATTQILAKVVSSAPRPVRIAQLEEATGRSSREISRLCQSLARAGLLRHATAAGKWELTCNPASVTLEDVFRCVLEASAERKPLRGATGKRAAGTDVEVFLMQAMLAINQSVFHNLRQFSLDRLKISAAGMISAPRSTLRGYGLEDDSDFAIAGREAGMPEPQRISA
jgi:DNA-binding IscR family transcriptional regulator